MKRELTWTGSYLHAASDLKTSFRQEDGDVVLHVQGRYARPDAPEQSLEGSVDVRIRPNGLLEVAYDYVPVNGHGMLLEAGLSLILPAAASEFRWIGAGPYAGYPGKDRLNEFGAFHLSRPDLRFQGNRRQVELALLTQPNGSGVALGGPGMDVAVEREDDTTILSHNAVVSGRGTKFVAPDVLVNADTSPRISGHFTLTPLTTAWPAALTRWFGAAFEPVDVFVPYQHSYDQ